MLCPRGITHGPSTICLERSMPLDYNKLISQEYQRRQKPAIRSLLSLENKPGMISFLAGKPNPDRFPFESITVKLKPSAVLSTDPSTGASTELVLDGNTLERVLQYGSTAGDPLLDEALNNLVSAVHGRTRHDGTPAGDFEITVGTGSQDLLAKVRMKEALTLDKPRLVRQGRYHPGRVTHVPRTVA